jgi:hypothetical protein
MGISSLKGVSGARRSQIANATSTGVFLQVTGSGTLRLLKNFNSFESVILKITIDNEVLTPNRGLSGSQYLTLDYSFGSPSDSVAFCDLSFSENLKIENAQSVSRTITYHLELEV